MVWEQLKTCYDPEIPVNIVDLGLVYGMEIAPLPDGSKRVDVKMTLTAQGCGMGASTRIRCEETSSRRSPASPMRTSNWYGIRRGILR